MTVEPSRQFSRDVRRLGSTQIRRRLDRTIQELIEVADITEVSGVRRLLDEGQHYRIRIGDYRLAIPSAPDDDAFELPTRTRDFRSREIDL